MQTSTLSDRNIYPATSREIVAQLGRSFAEIRFAYCDDGLFRFSLALQYSYGGYGGPIFAGAEPYPDIATARVAALEQLLADWPKPFAGDPASVHEELRLLRQQIAAKLSQPTLF